MLTSLFYRKAPPNIDTEQLLKAFQDEFGRGSSTTVFSVGQPV